jgi:hypothetical protein
MPPHFRPSTALLNWDKEILRWPGPFDTGFLSPQPPGVAGIGSIAEQIIPYWANASWSFFFFDAFDAAVDPGGGRITKIPRLSCRFKPPRHFIRHRVGALSIAEPPSSHS